jgi:hypothetical protein
MFVHMYCIACHQKLEYPAKDGFLSAMLFICASCTTRRRFQHLLCRRKGIIGLAAAMALTNPSYNFRQYKYIASSEWDEWPQLNEDISDTLCQPIRSLLRQNAFSRALRSFQRKRLNKGMSQSYSQCTHIDLQKDAKELKYTLAFLLAWVY